MPPTIQTIADKLGVSISTVSRSLRQDRLIHPKTRAKVIETAIEMGYQGRSRRRPNRPKHRLTVGVLLAQESLAAGRSSPIATRYMEGLSAEADACKVLLSLHSVKQDDRGRLSDPHVAPAMITENICDVVVVWGPHHSTDIAYILQQTPVVSLNWPYPDLNLDLVATDDVDGCRRIVDRLAMLGHRKMAFVYYSTPTYYDSRRAGFIDGCVRHELPLTEQLFIQPTPVWAPEPFITAVEQGVTAFVCVSDRVAEKIGPLLTAAGVRIPEDVSLTGFNADDHALVDGKTITSIDPQFIEMGRAALRVALQRYGQPAASAITLRPVGRLVDGQTVAPPRRVAFQIRPTE